MSNPPEQEFTSELRYQSNALEKSLKDLYGLIPNSLERLKTSLAFEMSDKSSADVHWKIELRRVSDLNRPFQFFIELAYFGGTFGFFPTEGIHAYHKNSYNAWGMYPGDEVEKMLANDNQIWTEELLKRTKTTISNALEKIALNFKETIYSEVCALGPDVKFLFSECAKWIKLQREGLEKNEELRSRLAKCHH